MARALIKPKGIIKYSNNPKTRAEYRYLLLPLGNTDFIKYRRNIQFYKILHLRNTA